MAIQPRNVRPDRQPAQQAADNTVPAGELDRRRRERVLIQRRADETVQNMAEREFFSVPRAYPAITGSLASAHALYIIERWSEQALIETGSAWVRVDEQEWINNTGLAPEEWIESRRILRDLGLIAERRYFNDEQQALANEYRFETSTFGRHLAELRADIQQWMLEDAQEQRRAEAAAATSKAAPRARAQARVARTTGSRCKSGATPGGL